MLIRKSERSRGRGKIASAETSESSGDGWDRRAFLKRSGVTAGALAALGNLPLGSVRKAAAGPPPPAVGGPLGLTSNRSATSLQADNESRP